MYFSRPDDREAVSSKIERDRVCEMFSDIAPTYDLLNRFLSFGIDRIWRRVAVRSLIDGLVFGRPARLLDLATGTGDVALAVDRSLSGQGDVQIVGADLAFPMLAVGCRKAEGRDASVCFLQADALLLPFEEDVFDGVIIAFGLRNLEDRQSGLVEMARVLRPGGRLVVLEFGVPQGLFGGLFHFYFRCILPVAGRLVSGHPTAYTYLPSTVSGFPAPGKLCAMMGDAGFRKVRNCPMTGGIVQVYSGERLENV